MRILRSANALIANNPKLFDKKLWSEHGTATRSGSTPAADDEAEAEGVVRRLLAHKFEHRGRYADYAILYRGNHQAQAVRAAAARAERAVHDLGGQSFFDRTEIKDLVAYLRLIANDDDDPAFIRAVTTPKRGIGATTLEQARRHRRRAAREPVRRGVRRPRRPRRCRRGSARSSTRSAR